MDSEPQMAQHYFRGDFAGKRCFTHRSNGLLVTMRGLRHLPSSLDPTACLCRRAGSHAPAAMPLILSRPKHVACALPPIAADLLGFLPADWLALGALAACSTLSGGAPCIGSTAGWEGGALEWLPLLRLLHLARLYRLRQLFSYLVRATAAFRG